MIACYHPLSAWSPKNHKSDTGKRIMFFHRPDGPLDNWEELKIPCGQCIGCRLDYSKDWATRIMLEAKDHEQNWFVTLTYDPEHVPIRSTLNTQTGEIVDGMSLWPPHCTKFMKDLRRYWEYHYGETGIRFYLVGEYGEESERPHYHLALFGLNLKPDMLEYWYSNEFHQPIFKCPVLRDIWGRGIVAVADLSWNSAAYIARYMTKKQKGKGSDEYYESKAQIPEFSRCSRRPGIGGSYFAEHADAVYSRDELICRNFKGPFSVKPPKYFDKLFDEKNPEAMANIKAHRMEVAVAAAEVQQSKTTLDPMRYRQVQERTKLSQSKQLVRSFERGKEPK